MVVMSKYGMQFLNTVIKIRFDRSECSSILLAYGTSYYLQMPPSLCIMVHGYNSNTLQNAIVKRTYCKGGGEDNVIVHHTPARKYGRTKHLTYSDQQNCPNVWYLSMVLKITYELLQMETNCEC